MTREQRIDQAVWDAVWMESAFGMRTEMMRHLAIWQYVMPRRRVETIAFYFRKPLNVRRDLDLC